MNKLVTTKDYLLLIDEELKGKIGVNYNIALLKIDVLSYNYPEHSSEWNYCKKVVAYYPLTKEAKELDLPLLPNPFEEDIDCWLFSAFESEEAYEKQKPFFSRVFFDHAEMKVFSGDHSFKSKTKYPSYVSVYWKYKAAQSKQFSLEDMETLLNVCKKASMIGTSVFVENTGRKFIQSLYTQQLPKEFIPERVDKGGFRQDSMNNCWISKWELKTITNTEGKQELVGQYKY